MLPARLAKKMKINEDAGSMLIYAPGIHIRTQSASA